MYMNTNVHLKTTCLGVEKTISKAKEYVFVNTYTYMRISEKKHEEETLFGRSREMTRASEYRRLLVIIIDYKR